MIPTLKLIVAGLPAPQGSKKPIPIFRGKGADREYLRTNLVESSTKVGPWRDQVVAAVTARFGWDPTYPSMPDPAALEAAGFPIDDGACARIVFTMPAIKDKRRRWPTTTPDLDKLLRSTFDALTDAGVLKSDARIVDLCRVAKVYPNSDDEALDRPGAFIHIHEPHRSARAVEILDELVEQLDRRPPEGALF